MNNQATTPFGYCLSMASWPVWLRWWNRRS